MRQRSTTIERVKRINRALKLLKKLQSRRKTINCLREEYGVSRPQAYRYVQEAGKLLKTLPVPEKKEAVIVKLPISMSKQVRRLRRKRKGSISGIMTESLRDYLKRDGI